MFSKCKKLVFAVVVTVVSVMLCGYTFRRAYNDDFKWIQQCLTGCFNASSGNVKLKKWELSLTNKGFFRLRKFFPNGKQEYFSFNVKRFNDLNYLGTTESGDIVIKTLSDDIIVQTYNDPRGNIDSMAVSLKIPVVNIEPETLDSLMTVLSVIKRHEE